MRVRVVFGATSSMPLYLNQSIARRRFKDLLGNANHSLITVLIGLHTVETETVPETIAPNLKAAWNSNNFKVSARRSRAMVLEMCLVRATDALDTYIRWTRRSPPLIQNTDLQQELDSCGQSVLRKFRSLSKHCPEFDTLIAALIEIMIVWKNRSIHSLAENEISHEVRAILQKNEKKIKEMFERLDVIRMLTDLEKNGPPTFKETASFIRNTHEAVRILDDHLLTSLDSEQFLIDLIRSVIFENARGDMRRYRKDRAQSIWGRDNSDRVKRVDGFLTNNGLSPLPKKRGSSAKFPDELVEKINSLTPSELLDFVRPK